MSSTGDGDEQGFVRGKTRWATSSSRLAALSARKPDFLELDTREWQEDDYDQQGNLLDPIKVKEGKREEIEWVL